MFNYKTLQNLPENCCVLFIFLRVESLRTLDGESVVVYKRLGEEDTDMVIGGERRFAYDSKVVKTFMKSYRMENGRVWKGTWLQLVDHVK